MTGETVMLWAGKHGPYLVTRDQVSIDFLEKSVKVQAEFNETIIRLLGGLVSRYDPEDRDALIDAIITRFGSSSVAAYA